MTGNKCPRCGEFVGEKCLCFGTMLSDHCNPLEHADIHGACHHEIERLTKEVSLYRRLTERLLHDLSMIFDISEDENVDKIAATAINEVERELIK